MNIAVAADWRDQSQSALQEVVDLYGPNELTLVNAVNLGPMACYPLSTIDRQRINSDTSMSGVTVSGPRS
jgi:hypothetical protein